MGGCVGCDCGNNGGRCGFGPICYPACGNNLFSAGCNCPNPEKKFGCCFPCAAGFAGDHGGCVPCYSGTFADTPASAECKACPAGKYSQHEMPGTPACSRTGAPPFVNTGGLVLCNPINCPINTEGRHMAMNATDCTPCPAGMSSQGGADLCRHDESVVLE